MAHTDGASRAGSVGNGSTQAEATIAAVRGTPDDDEAQLLEAAR